MRFAALADGVDPDAEVEETADAGEGGHEGTSGPPASEAGQAGALAPGPLAPEGSDLEAPGPPAREGLGLGAGPGAPKLASRRSIHRPSGSRVGIADLTDAASVV